MPTQHTRSLENREKEGEKSKLFTRVVLPALTKDLFHAGKRKLETGKKNLSPRTDNQIKYCYIFCLISTRSSITSLIKHIILLQKVSLIYAKSDLDILSLAVEIS